MIPRSVLSIMPKGIREQLVQLAKQKEGIVQEIRIRASKPLLIVMNNEEYGLTPQGLGTVSRSWLVTYEEVQAILQFLSGYSLYALEDEIRQGYVTIEGGHRIGLVGKAVIEDKKVKTLKYISGLNIRLSHEFIGCSDKVMPYLISRDKVYHTLVVSPPKCGKTTLLRDIIRNLSNGYSGYGPYTVGVVDERSEVAGCYMGVPQNDVGLRTDVLDGCPKVEGMRMLLRSMAPDVIAVDEVGSLEDLQAIEEVLGAGVTIVCTTHGKDLEDCMKKPQLRHMLEQGWFEKVVVLSSRNGPCTVEQVEDFRRNQVSVC
ncbi:MAG: stage III sporulation protein AA [Niameybacter sp.]|uniref:stage III sporulation protein AA n=1 Tax=Niameybacter sp. TaxID=2033640 RepID=UPI002FCADF05